MCIFQHTELFIFLLLDKFIFCLDLPAICGVLYLTSPRPPGWARQGVPGLEESLPHARLPLVQTLNRLHALAEMGQMLCTYGVCWEASREKDTCRENWKQGSPRLKRCYMISLLWD